MRFRFHHTSYRAIIVILGLCIASCERGGPSGPKAPAFSLSATSIVFSDENNQQVVTISNLSSHPLDWRVLSSTASWLSASPTGGIMQPGASGTLAIQVDRVALPSGTHSAELQIEAAGQSALINVSVQEPLASPAVASVQPSVLTLGPMDVSKLVEVTNTGGSTLTWTLSGPSWATLAPGSGSLAPGGRSQILVSPDRTGLTNGLYLGTLQFSSNGGSRTVALELNVSGLPGPPLLTVSPVFLDFQESATELSLSLNNEGDEPLEWTAQPDASWISLPVSAGSVSPHSSVSVTVRVSRSGLTAGTYQSALRFTSNGGETVATIAMTVSSSPPDSTSPPPPDPSPANISLNPTSLDFGSAGTELPVVIQNTGGVPLDWLAIPAHGYLSVSPSSGRIGPGDSQTVAVLASRSGLSAGLYESSIQFNSNGGSRALPVTLLVDADVPEPGSCNPESPSAAGADDPIAAKVLACGADTFVTSVTALTSAAAQTLVLVWVGSATEEEVTNLPTVQGGGMTWDLVATHVRNAEVRRLSVFRGMSSTPSAGLLTITFNGQEQVSLGWGVVQYSGVDVSGVNGSGAVIQTGTGSAEELETSAMAKLVPFSSPSNTTVGGFFAGTNDLTPGKGFVELFEAGPLKRRVMVEFKPSPDTTVDATWPNGVHWLAIALELKSTTGS